MKRQPLAAFLLLCTVATATAQSPGDAMKVSFVREIQPILAAHCYACHGPDEKTRKAKLRLDTAEGAFAQTRSGMKAVVRGDSKKSELVARIQAADPTERMPPAKSGKELKKHDVDLLTRWIDEGAEFQPHWSFVSPRRPVLPEIKNTGWVRNPIDRFVLAELEAEKLNPSPEADRYTLARRVALDLTGLPPSLEQADRFVNDSRPDAYERYVDEVLSSPAYGERWAQVWLDLARYADSNGYAEDQPRVIWKFRDWVIRAINENLPFDRFTIEQLAGDLLPSPTPDQLIATAFHRNTLTNTEGGTNDEEFRNVAVVDRVNTTFQVWMGLTMACANCHNHRFDPISQEEYFRVFAIFNQTEDADSGDNSPNLPHLSPEDAKIRANLEADQVRLEKEIAGKRPHLADDQATWEKTAPRDKLPGSISNLLNVEIKKRTAQQKEEIGNFFRAAQPDISDLHQQTVKNKAALAKVQPVPTPIMKELPKSASRVTKIHVRGDWLNLGPVVEPGVPSMFQPLPKELPPNRLALAKWLVDPRNPLTSRVAVNRYWEQVFGVGLVHTPEDFGLRSQPPRHQELLDWLAVEFEDQKWDVKKLLTLIVTSATYRQSSKVTPAMVERDPDNRLFARGSRVRSSAEVVRDQALAIGGLLSRKMYGPSVRPPQPRFNLAAAFGPGTDWTDSTGDDKYRRGLYTYWRRTTPYPSMVTFDAPTRTVCTVSRARTNTPLQALVTLNDPCYVEAAQALARRMVKEGGGTVVERVRLGFRLALVRPAQEKELERLVDLYERVRAEFAKSPQEAIKMATEPLGPLPSDMDAVELASWTVVSNVLLNLDETLARP